MQGPARTAAIIECIAEILATPRPADAITSAFFRGRRYIGSGDRKAINEAVWRILRSYGRLTWWMGHLGHATETREATARAIMLADLMLARDGYRPLTREQVIAHFSGEGHAPEKLRRYEHIFTEQLEGQPLIHEDMPDLVRLECPPEMEAGLRQAFGYDFETEMTAMLEPAPLYLRVNPVMATRDEAAARLTGADIQTTPCHWSPLGLKVEGRPNLAVTDAFKQGMVEVQDEGSQLIALLLAARPGEQVVDFCAGAGGKTLAIAGTMENRGRVVACDVLEGRLKRSRDRFKRAGLHNIEIRALSSETDKWVKRSAEKFDRVLVDAPCSGTGTWRRNPDARWRALGPGLSELVPLQRSILASASRLVKPGGRLVYATCSVLAAENEDQVKAFLEAHADFEAVPLSHVWADTGSLADPPCPDPYMAMRPGRHGTDGFFAAILRRKADDSQA